MTSSSKKELGGGIFIAVFKDIALIMVGENSNDSESLWIRINCSGVYIIFSVVYFPTRSASEVFQNYLDNLSKILTGFRKITVILYIRLTYLH